MNRVVRVVVVDDEALVRSGFGLILSASEDIEIVASASGDSGAAGFLLKDTEPDQLAQLIRRLAAGGVVLSPKASRTLMHSHPGTETAFDAEAAGIRLLTARERDVLALVTEGLSNVDIGARIHLGAGTVKDHVSAILTKLRVTSRVQAALPAQQAGLLDERPRSEAGR